MSKRDDELDFLLKPLRDAAPNSAQMQSWQRAVESEARVSVLKVTRSRMFLQMAAAMLVGAFIGAAVMKSLVREPVGAQLIAQNSFSSATFEHTHTNLD